MRSSRRRQTPQYSSQSSEYPPTSKKSSRRRHTPQYSSQSSEYPPTSKKSSREGTHPNTRHRVRNIHRRQRRAAVKAPSSILVTEFGISTDVKEEQSQKALSQYSSQSLEYPPTSKKSSLRRHTPNTRHRVRNIHRRQRRAVQKAPSSILVTEFGISTDVKEEQPWKANSQYSSQSSEYPPTSKKSSS